MRKQSMLNNREISSFCSQTAMIFRAGIPPVEGMALLLEDAKTSDARALYQSIYDVAQSGESFYNSVKSTGLFPDYVLNMISLGEASGNLDDVMQTLADYYRREEEISSNIKEAIRYPFIMILMMFIIIIVLITKVLPIFQQVFEQLGSTMNGMSQSLLHMGQTINNYSLVFMGILLFLCLLYVWGTKSKTGKRVTSALLSKLPATRELYENVAAERFASGMAMGLSSGLDTFQSLDLTMNLIDNNEFDKKVMECKQSVMNGNPFVESLAATGIFSNFYIRMISIGWHTGSADEVMRTIAREYDEANTRKIQNLISILEPTLVIILSLIIGLILMSVILPLLGVMSSIG